MVWYWIVLIVLALLVTLLCMTKVGVLAEFGQEALKLDARIGPFTVQLFPQKEKPPKKKQAAGKKSEKPAKKKLPKIALADIKDAVAALWPPLKRALGRTRRGIRIKPLTLSITVGAEEDPASGAETYGYLHSGVWTGMPMLEQLLVIPDPRIHIGIDFDNPKTVAEGRLGLSIRIGTLLMVAMGVGIPALRWFLRFQKPHKTTNTTPAQPGDTTAA